MTSGGFAGLLLTAAHSNLEAWSIGPIVIRPRPWLYAAFLAVFFTMARTALSALSTPPAVGAGSRFDRLWPLALCVVGAILVRSGMVPSQHLGLAFVERSFETASGAQILNVFRPAWLRSFAAVELGQYRPLKFLLLWVAYRLHGTTLALIGGHMAVGGLIFMLLTRWGVGRWVAAMMALGFVMHPLTIWYLGTITIQYVWGTLAFLSALYALQRWLDRPRTVSLVLAVGLFAISTLFIESWLGGVAILIGVLIGHWKASRDEGIPSIGFAIALFVAVTVAITSVHVWALSYESSRLGMASTPRVRRLVLNLWFEPYWAFFMPFESKATLVQLVAASGLALVPGMALMRRTKLAWPGPMLWVTTGMSLGPALMFFEMSPRWSTGRIAYGPCAVLALCVGLIIAQTVGHRLAAIWASLCCAGLIVLSVLQVTSSPPADLGGRNRPHAPDPNLARIGGDERSPRTSEPRFSSSRTLSPLGTSRARDREPTQGS